MSHEPVDHPCPVCGKKAVWFRAREAEVIPIKRTVIKQAIGQLYYHEDGAICDRAVYGLTKLATPELRRLVGKAEA